MIDQADRRLQEWVKGTVDVPSISLAPPTDEPAGRSVNLYLLDISLPSPPRGDTRPPLQLSLRYLITTAAPDIQEAHRLLATLALAALEQPDWELEPAPPPAELWAALRVLPRPALLLRVLLRVERPTAPAKLVRKPLVVQAAPATTLSGVVLGPEDMPLAGAIVQIPALQISKRADNQGRFSFAMLPAEPPVKQLRIRAKGRVLDYTLEEPPPEGTSLVINFPLE